MKRVSVFVVVLSICTALFAQSNLDKAKEALVSEDFESVIYYSQKHLSEKPKDAMAYMYLALANYYTSKPEVALDDINKGIGLWKKKCELPLSAFYKVKGDLCLGLEKYDEALDCYNTAIKKDGNNPRMYQARGLYYCQMEKNDLAETDLRKAIELGSDDLRVFLELGRILLMTNREQEGNRLLDYIIQQEPRIAEPYRLKAVSAIMKEDYKAAVDNLIPYHSLAYNDISMLLYCSKREYAYTLNAVTKQISGSADVQFRAYWYSIRARIYMANDMFVEAINDWSNKMVIDADTAAVVFNNYQLGMCYDELERYPEAINCYTKVIDEFDKAGQKDSEVLFRRSFDYLAIDSLSQAYSDAMASIAVDLNFAPAAYYVTSQVLAKQGKTAAAIDELQKGLMLDSANVQLRLEIAKLYLSMDRQDDAYRELDVILSNTEKVQPSMLIHVMYYRDLKDLALATTENLLRSEEISGDDFYNIACFYSLLQDKDKALLYLRKSLEKGYRQFVHISKDTDLDFIRETDEFKNLIHQYDNR